MIRRDISVIIPTLNAAATLGRTMAAVEKDDSVEIIVSDGGSEDGTVPLARDLGAVVVEGPRGRGRQMNAGARAAAGAVLLFLHADTILSDQAFGEIRRFIDDPSLQVATFSLRFDGRHALLRVYEFFARFDSVLTRFGDTGIVVRREFFDRLNGFPDTALFEDVAFFRTARRVTKISYLDAYAVTSAEKFTKKGMVRQQLFNGWLLTRYLCGASPDQLSRLYDDT